METRSPRNRTLVVQQEEETALIQQTISLTESIDLRTINNKIIHQDFFDCVDFLPDNSIDLLIVDPPYNLTKQFSASKFSKMSEQSYEDYIESWFSKLVRCLKKTSSIYVCCDWQSSKAIQAVLEKYVVIRNRITWEREKGRGALRNWKNCSEDIWFATVSNEYYFDVDAVKLKKKVLTPYKTNEGEPKDWEDSSDGKYRLTYPSNLWTDITIPFWSMPENTDHPTQKPEKLIAKLMLASSKEGDMVFDPFLGSGTTAVVAKKLGRNFSGIEREKAYCQLTMKRLQLAEDNKTIQGYSGECFWDRNSLSEQKQSKDSLRSHKVLT